MSENKDKITREEQLPEITEVTADKKVKGVKVKTVERKAMKKDI